MNKIHITASNEYDVLIGRNILEETARLVKEVSDPLKAVLVSDDNVYPLYGDTVKNNLEKNGIRVYEFVFPHGEKSKCLEVYAQLLEFMCASCLTRSDILIALGGGVTGDMGGFAAATYQRGIKYIQIPTTLLAAVDSSVGGKTAVNLKNGKNQVGCFWQPSLVICDINTLNTLPEREFINGSAEVIKYGMIRDADFLDKLSRTHISDWLEDVIARCVRMKSDVVSRDEYDTGERMLLNFGHTLGHGIEKCSDYTIPHGFAVSIGMAMITESAQKKGICPPGTYENLTDILQKYKLPVKADYTAAEIAAAAVNDKKSTADTLRIIIPVRSGECKIEKIKSDELISWA